MHPKAIKDLAQPPDEELWRMLQGRLQGEISWG
jgi:hypothetical protein